MIDRLEIDTQLAEIQARRIILFDQQRSATYPEAEFFEKLRRLDSEERYWRSRLLAEDNPTPLHLPQWGKDLWKAVLDLQADVISWREERRSERVEDMKERDRARWRQQLWMAFLAALLVIDMVARALT